MSPGPSFSVVIPTHNRLDVLPEVVAALERQVEAPSFEIVVVDDGSTDGTSAWLTGVQVARPLKRLHQQNRGPAAARNLGVAAAVGQWVAFLGDDTVPEADWLACHDRAHKQRLAASPVAVIGYTRWHPRIRVDPFLHYINEHGLQFGYALIDDPGDVPFNFFYTSNLSLERRWLVAEPFDEAFPYPAWEDIELSYRLGRHGLRLVYEPAARVQHDHPTDLARFCRRQWRAGYSAVVFYRRHPELAAFLGLGASGPPPLPPAWRRRSGACLARCLHHFLRWAPADWRSAPPAWLPRLWESVLRGHYIAGLKQAWADGAGDIARGTTAAPYTFPDTGVLE